MKSIIVIFSLIMGVNAFGISQKVFTKSGKISFYSDAPLEKIEAHNTKATSIIDLENGRMEFAVLIKAFYFEKALMQEHFNENYMESSKFPKSIFKGKIDDYADYDFSGDGEYNVRVSGDLTIHGVTKPISAPGTIVVKEGLLSADSKFEIKVADYNIDIPSLVKDNIAKTVEVLVHCDYKSLTSKS